MEYLMNYLSNQKVLKAFNYAKKMHEGQLRRDGTPYIEHPIRVANYVARFKDFKNIEILIVSALLHDTIENTETTYYDIENLFDYAVANIVEELTIDEEKRKELGKEKYLETKMEKMTNWALIIKLCDRLDNTSDLTTSNEEFKNRYSTETLDVLTYVVNNRPLTTTHIEIIEEIINNIAKVQNPDNETKLQSISDILTRLQPTSPNDIPKMKILTPITSKT